MEHCGPNGDASPVTLEEEGQHICVFLCVCGEVVGGHSRAPKRFVLAKRFPCPSQTAGLVPPLVVEEEEQKEHRGRGDTCTSASKYTPAVSTRFVLY